jgi:hypothetical protein
LKQRLIGWLQFWRAANTKPFLLLASAEVTLGVRTILTMVKNRIWHWQHTAVQQLLQQPGLPAAQQHQKLQRALQQWQQLQGLRGGVGLGAQHSPGGSQQKQQQHGKPLLRILQQQQQQPDSGGSSSSSASMLAYGLTTLYQLGVETNRQMLEDILVNSEVRL